ncbi:hypothetical protein GQ53DRAFT_753934 [Thozetella sp. PMI_491]|nr:hypothetical protein GQ53DRAFT_753934 [Thozetella sp. PMI_491]
MSYLTFFSILGTLARLGLESLTTYPDAPIAFPTLWVNLGGSLFLGLLAQSSANINNALSKSSLSKQDSSGSDDSEPAQEEAQCDSEEAAGQGGADANDSPPPRKPSLLYIGLSTGFCGSFTTFSSFVRDAFLDLSMNLVSPPPSRGAGDDAMAVLAVIITTVCVCLAAMKAGAHIALLLQPTNWVITGRLHRLFDRIIPIVGAGTWAGAIIMAVLPPDRSSGSATSGSMRQETWRGLVLFAVVFAPVGCIMRFYLSIKLNAFRPSFPLGTFTANILGTAVLGLAWDLQHSARGSTNIHCQVFQGIMDGLCGCLTTVSTWVAELSSLRRRHAYVYGATTLGVSLSLLVIIMGSQKWTTGWVDPVCG